MSGPARPFQALQPGGQDQPAQDAISILPGSAQSDRAVIAFAGVQAQLGGIELWEFAKTLAPEGGGGGENQRPVAFVRERPARWYNTLEPDLLLPFVAAQAGRKTVALGNSMGGYAAILFSALLPDIRRSIAFSPQFSVHPDHCPWEVRWREPIAGIDRWRFETCLPGGASLAAATLDHFVFCGTDIRHDVRHAEAIVREAPRPASAFLIHGCGHDLVRVLKDRGMLVPLLDLLIDNLAPASQVADYLSEHGMAFDLLSSSK